MSASLISGPALCPEPPALELRPPGMSARYLTRRRYPIPDSGANRDQAMWCYFFIPDSRKLF
jgi:hypothetical protein